jgi:serine/threonine protein kinase
MGRVWQAWDEYLHRNVAIKEVTPRGGGESDPSVQRTLREARAAAMLRHPGIITVHDVVTDDGRPWIVMELIEGRSLADWLHDDGPLPVQRAAEIAIKVIEALDSAHQQGVLHRDVKPGNIMLDKDRVVLTDFGIAVIDGATALTGTGQLIGSPEYIAPERIDGHEANHAADLWAVGITLYGMVVGRTPFHRTDTSATLAAIVAREPDPDPVIGPLWPVIQGLLRKKPAERLTATASVALLREVTATPAAQPAVTPWLPTVRGGPTRIDHPESQATVEHATALNTRPAMPPLPPIRNDTGPVAPWDVTIDAVQPPPRRRPKTAIYVAVAALLAVVITIVVITTSNHGSGTPLPPFKPYQESLGFSITVPQDYVRHASTPSAASDVVWQAVQNDPTVGTLQVLVRLDDSHPGTSPTDYLSATDRTESADPNVFDYQRVSLTGKGNGPAELEYTYVSQTSGEQVHVRDRAVAGVHRYVLTFTLNAQDASTLRAQWQSLQPIMAKIRDTFQITP